MHRIKRFGLLALAIVLLFSLAGCMPPEIIDPVREDIPIVLESENPAPTEEKDSPEESALPEETSLPTETPLPEETPLPQTGLPQEGEFYYDAESVALYIYLYGELPLNFITKSQAEALGWNGGSVERYLEDAAIGGDRFGNREGLLPTAKGRQYTECDIDTLGRDSRGARRLIFSNDGLFFYTDDHYESFTELTITEDYTVEWK